MIKNPQLINQCIETAPDSVFDGRVRRVASLVRRLVSRVLRR